MIADGLSAVGVTVTLRDALGNPVPGQTVESDSSIYAVVYEAFAQRLQTTSNRPRFACGLHISRAAEAQIR